MILGAALTAMIVTTMVPQAKTYPGWHTNTQQAFNEARKTGKPLFIVFR